MSSAEEVVHISSLRSTKSSPSNLFWAIPLIAHVLHYRHGPSYQIILSVIIFHNCNFVS